tara:strand:- start:243 stop:605 length:363 start_codon:yes stop_codon:yes gene_type:complete
MKILGLAGLYLFYREFSKGVSPITVVPPEPPKNGLTPEEKARQEERERARKEAEDASIARQRESDRIAAEEKKRLDNLFFARQAEIKANPPFCGYGRRAQLRGAGTRASPYSWECILTGF